MNLNEAKRILKKAGYIIEGFSIIDAYDALDADMSEYEDDRITVEEYETFKSGMDDIVKKYGGTDLSFSHNLPHKVIVAFNVGKQRVLIDCKRKNTGVTASINAIGKYCPTIEDAISYINKIIPVVIE